VICLRYKTVKKDSFYVPGGREREYTSDGCIAIEKTTNFRPLGGKPLLKGVCEILAFDQQSWSKKAKKTDGMKCMYDMQKRQLKNSVCRHYNCPLRDGKRVFALLPDEE
jgi:hypothetical protein